MLSCKSQTDGLNCVNAFRLGLCDQRASETAFKIIQGFRQRIRNEVNLAARAYHVSMSLSTNGVS